MPITRFRQVLTAEIKSSRSTKVQLCSHSARVLSYNMTAGTFACAQEGCSIFEGWGTWLHASHAGWGNSATSPVDKARMRIAVRCIVPRTTQIGKLPALDAKISKHVLPGGASPLRPASTDDGWLADTSAQMALPYAAPTRNLS